MRTQFLERCVLSLALLLTGTFALDAQSGGTPPPGKAKNKLTILTVVNGPDGDPSQLAEISPGTFAGVSGEAFLLTSTGTLTNIAQIQASEVETSRAVQAVNGSLYGWAYRQQSCGFGPDCDFNFSFDASGNVQYYTPTPQAVVNLSLALPDGSLVGGGFGGLMRMTPGGAVTVLHTFPDSETVYMPVLATDGNFYGIARTLHVQASVYRLTPKGEMTVLKTYKDGGAYIANFYEYLVQAGDGNLYGTVGQGGDHQAGAIFRISPDGKDYKVLYSFPHLVDGIPSFLAQGSDGNLYGAAVGEVHYNGASSLFRISREGKFEKLQELNGLTEGHCPCYLTLGSDGKLYGTVAYGGPGGGVIFVWDLGMPKPKPKFNGLRPESGAAGSNVLIWGDHLLGATAVTFNGTPAAINSVSKQFVSVTVPTGATTGRVTIATPNGKATSHKPFTVQ